MRDEHQQLHQFHQGDVIAVPAGVAHWLYNNGDSPVVAFTVIDTSNNANQLDPKRREFSWLESLEVAGSSNRTHTRQNN